MFLVWLSQVLNLASFDSLLFRQSSASYTTQLLRLPSPAVRICRSFWWSVTAATRLGYITQALTSSVHRRKRESNLKPRFASTEDNFPNWWDFPPPPPPFFIFSSFLLRDFQTCHFSTYDWFMIEVEQPVELIESIYCWRFSSTLKAWHDDGRVMQRKLQTVGEGAKRAVSLLRSLRNSIKLVCFVM